MRSTAVKKYRTRKGTKLVPIKVYPYYSLKKQIRQLFNKKDFVASCEKWRSRSTMIGSDFLGDIYDGAVWKRFNSPDRLNFLTSPHSYLLTLNIDWFQPFDRGIYSVGAIYMTIQNLPRSERYKLENILLIGVIPGPKEPKHNKFLSHSTGFGIKRSMGRLLCILISATTSSSSPGTFLCVM